MRGERGFTLLEVMIATAIMSLGIVASLELFSGSLRLAGEADRQSHAMILVRSLVDEELWRDILEEGVRAGTEGGFAWSVETRVIERALIGIDEENGDFDDPDDDIGLWLIHAEVAWEAPRGQRRVTLETARIGEQPL